MAHYHKLTEYLTPASVLKRMQEMRGWKCVLRKARGQWPWKEKLDIMNEKEEDEEDIPDAARMKVDDGQEGHS